MLRVSFLIGVLAFFTPIQAQLDLIGLLPSAIQETSGLIHVQNTLISHNDSGGSNALYSIDPNTGAIVGTCYVANASNVDWEDLAADDEYIYIADFGNNTGSRSDLKIYRVSQADYFNTSNDTVYADTIEFNYADQLDFTAGSNSTNYDAEALMVKGDSLYIFTKRWLDQSSSVYTVSNQPGNYSLNPLANLASDGLVTGAVYDSISSSVYLCGYGPPVPFLMEIKNFTAFPIQPSTISKLTLQVPLGASVQIEGITIRNSNKLFLSSEQSVLGDAALMTMDKSVTVHTIDRNKSFLKPYPNPVKGQLHLSATYTPCIELFNAFGQLVEKTCTKMISVEHLPNGIYFLREAENVQSNSALHSIIVNNQ